jgi:hypothetical protein
MELVAELAHATRRPVRSQKHNGAAAETRCKTPRLRPSTARKHGSEVNEAKEVDEVIDVGLSL